ncbi:M20 family metallo-hydrolase [Microbacterium sp. 18062]|uniref:M20 family metallo-hydrolase n=1 Tax=Microbacterium sp. 18062 TaxID=2681410 RepID=UPI001F2CCEFD|nr:M20 family metallo-hydrolase [Microbacterium sp. 18062]
MDMSAEQDQLFLTDFWTMSSFGATERGGVHREAGTAAHGELTDWFAGLLAESGFVVRRDAIGNVYGLAELTPGAPYVLFGSHLDSQPYGGKYDGAYGVLAALHAARRVVDAHRVASTAPKYNIAVVDWFNEEGSRFKPGLMGSAVVTGKVSLEAALDSTDPRGVSVREALAAIGGVGDFEAPVLAGYAEIHIEQGPSMAESGHTIGAVHATWSAYKYDVLVKGEQGHTGSMRMADRQDALLGAAYFVAAVNELIEHFPVESLHTTVAELHVEPNSPVTIAREVRMGMDMRAESTEVLDQALALLRKRVAEIEAKTRTTIEFPDGVVWDASDFIEKGVSLVESAAADLNLPGTRVKTLAGHDATHVKDIAPTILVFIPSIGGLSHNERELSTEADLLAGLNVFEKVVAGVANGELD